MFDLNEKCILVASSYHKQTGPRKGSVGYVTSVYNSLKILNHNSLACMTANVRFIRYGNEKKTRSESKYVVLTFPILRENVRGRLEQFIHAINSNKHIEEWNRVRNILGRDYYVDNHTPVVLAIPIFTQEINFVSCSKHEFFSWFEGCLILPQMTHFISRALASNHFFKNDEYNGVTLHNLVTLQDMMVDRDFRQKHINDMCENSSYRNTWIKILRIVMIVIGYVNQITIIDKLDYITKHSLLRDSKDIYSTFIPYIFHRAYYMYKNIYTKQKRLTGTMSRTIKEMENTKAAILNSI